jgi:hypothetical protein
MTCCHLTQYCRSNTAVDIARMHKVSSSPVGIKYKFDIHVAKGIKNAIDLHQMLNWLKTGDKRPTTPLLSWETDRKKR